jgi:hypothetical protein
MTEQVEQRLIKAAKAYAEANGMPEDTRAIGLFVAGAAIACRLPEAVRAEVVERFDAQFPNDVGAQSVWAAYVAGDVTT